VVGMERGRVDPPPRLPRPNATVPWSLLSPRAGGKSVNADANATTRSVLVAYACADSLTRTGGGDDGGGENAAACRRRELWSRCCCVANAFF
jgi:hypothetical protein